MRHNHDMDIDSIAVLFGIAATLYVLAGIVAFVIDAFRS